MSNADGSPATLKAYSQTKHIQCSTRVGVPLIRSWPEVQQVVLLSAANTCKGAAEDPSTAVPLRQDGHFTPSFDAQSLQIHSSLPEQTLRRLLALDEQLSELSVSSASLEQAFLQLTQLQERCA